MSDKTGIEMLEEILSKLETLEKRLSILDMNVKILMNANKTDFTKPIVQPKPPPSKNFSFEPVDIDKVRASKDGGETIKKVKGIVVTGKLKAKIDGNLVKLSKVNVKIYNTKDELIKSTRSNANGEWVSHLPPGKYIALFEGEYKGKKLLPQNKTFMVPESLPEGQIEYEVS